MTALSWNVIVECDRIARAGHTYVKDPVRKDRWRSFHAAAMHGEPWKGDCDDLASTALMILSLSGAPDDTLVRLLVDSSQDGVTQIDHFIGACVDRDGQWWIVGDTFGAAYRFGSCQHTILQQSPVDAGTDWQKFTGFN